MNILKIEKVKKSFGGVHALAKCSLEMEKGKITAIIGPNGSGKTTLFNTISNIEHVDAGKIILENHNISKTKDFEIAKAGISRTFQQVRLFRNLTIKDHIEIAKSEDDEKLLRNLIRIENEETDIKKTLEIVGLDKPINTYASDLSYGQRKLLDLAIAIAKPHKILMLDEPVAGVNPQLRQKIKSIIKKLQEKGETIILIEHDMNFVMDLANKIYVMDAGKIIAKGTPTQIQKNKKVLEAYLGN